MRNWRPGLASRVLFAPWRTPAPATPWPSSFRVTAWCGAMAALPAIAGASTASGGCSTRNGPSLPLSRPQGGLSAPDVFDRRGQHAHRFLRGVESHRVLGFDEVEQELRLALFVARAVDWRARRAGIDGAADVVEQRKQRVHGRVAHLIRAVLDRVHAFAQFVR